MSEYKLMEHRSKSEVKFWARKVLPNRATEKMPNFPVAAHNAAYEVKYPRKMYVDAQDVPAAKLCVWSGYLSADAVRELYREA